MHGKGGRGALIQGGVCMIEGGIVGEAGWFNGGRFVLVHPMDWALISGIMHD